jgi:protein-disulfide isomerase
MTLRSDVTVDVLAQLSASFGLDFAVIADKMQSKEIADIINQNALLAQRLQITGTPTFILEEEMLRGYVPLEQMIQFVGAVREGS